MTGLAVGEKIGRDVGRVDEVLGGKEPFGPQVLVDRLDRGPVLVRRHRRLHVQDRQEPVVVARLGQMDLVPAPVAAPLARVARLGVVG